MSATAIRPFSTDPKSPIQPLLELALLQSNAKGAYVYRFEREKTRAMLVAFTGPALAEAPQAELHPGTVAPHWNRKTPLVLAAKAAADWRFSGFPEFQTGYFEGVASIPLLDSGEIVGVANFCRDAQTPLPGRALAFLMSLSAPLGALLVAATLREQLQKANRDLADRKVVERAKGLLQERFQWSEEEAYLRLRRLSRRRRTPLREIAREVIESAIADLPEALAQHD